MVFLIFIHEDIPTMYFKSVQSLENVKIHMLTVHLSRLKINIFINIENCKAYGIIKTEIYF